MGEPTMEKIGLERENPVPESTDDKEIKIEEDRDADGVGPKSEDEEEVPAWREIFGIKLYSRNYFRSVSGVVHILELMFGVTVFGMSIATRWYFPENVALLLLVVSSNQWITSLYILVSILFTPSGASLKSSLIWLLHHGFAALLYFGGSVSLLIQQRYAVQIVVGTFGVFLSILHIIHAVEGFKLFYGNARNRQQENKRPDP